MSWINIIALIVIPIALFNVISPLIIFRAQKLPARVQFSAVDENGFLRARSERFNDLDTQMRGLGFNYIGSSMLPDTHNIAYFSLYSNEVDGTTGMLITMENKLGSFTYAEFSQLYSDGTMLDVSNASVVSAYPRMPLKIAARFPNINDLDQLYAILSRIRASANNTAAPVGSEPEIGFSKVEEFIARESDDLVRLGYLKSDIDAEGKRRLTLKGAFLITWRSIFPGRRIFDALDRSHSRKILKNA